MGSIIDGHRWLKERIHHLEVALQSGQLGEDQRAAVEEELVRLREEAGRTGRRRWLRRLGGQP